MVLRRILIGLTVWIVSLNAYATEVRSTLQSGVEIKPGEPMVIAIQSQRPMEIGWTVDHAAPCDSPCIGSVDMSSRNKDVLSSDTGASQLYRPKDGTIKIEFRNLIDRPVTIDIYMVEQVCDSGAEACEFLKLDELGDWLVYKIEKFTSIETSKDGSYSKIEGSTTRGKIFTLMAVWWFDGSEENTGECQDEIVRYIQERSPISEYSPYILSGRSAAKNKSVLVNIDTCAPNGSDFAVPDAHVF